MLINKYHYYQISYLRKNKTDRISYFLEMKGLLTSQSKEIL